MSLGFYKENDLHFLSTFFAEMVKGVLKVITVDILIYAFYFVIYSALRHSCLTSISSSSQKLISCKDLYLSHVRIVEYKCIKT